MKKFFLKLPLKTFYVNLPFIVLTPVYIMYGCFFIPHSVIISAVAIRKAHSSLTATARGVKRRGTLLRLQPMQKLTLKVNALLI